MTKRKYCKGVRVVNIAELSNYHGFLYIRDKIWHPGWWSNLQYNKLDMYIRENIVYYAEKKNRRKKWKLKKKMVDIMLTN